MGRKCICLVLVFVSLLSGGQNRQSPVALEPGQVPEAVMSAFTTGHPGETGAWFLLNEEYKVEFVQKDARVAHWIMYDKEGKVVKRDTEVETVPGDSHEPGNNRRPSSEPDSVDDGTQRGPRSEALRYDSEGLPVHPENKASTPGDDGKRDGR